MRIRRRCDDAIGVSAHEEFAGVLDDAGAGEGGGVMPGTALDDDSVAVRIDATRSGAKKCLFRFLELKLQTTNRHRNAC